MERAVEPRFPVERVVRVPFDQSAWPAVPAFRLVAADAAALDPALDPAALDPATGIPRPSWDAALRALTVSLPKATTTTVTVLSFVEGEDLPLLGVWAWIREALQELSEQVGGRPDGAGELEVLGLDAQVLVERARTGGHWMITPGRTLTLVHAVQQPLGRPVLELQAAQRSPDENAARLSGRLHVHGASTLQVDLLAGWSDRVNDPRLPPGTGTCLCTAQLSSSGSRTPPPPDRSSPAAARRARWAGTTREPTRLASTSTRRRSITSATPGTISCATRRRPPRGSASTSTRTPLSPVPATTSCSRCRPRPARRRRHLPTSSRPSAGSAPRRRPSGPRSAMVAACASTSTPPGGAAGRGSCWGSCCGRRLSPSPPTTPPGAGWARSSPAGGWTRFWPSEGVVGNPAVGDFLEAAASDAGVDLPELTAASGPAGVDVVGHAVSWDAERGLWYADIVVQTATAYFPFLRMALARWQPASIPGAALSHVVLADVAQLAPDRAVLVTMDPWSPGTAQVIVSGPGYQLAEEFPFRPQTTVVTVEVQTRVDGIDDDVSGVGGRRPPSSLRRAGRRCGRGDQPSLARDCEPAGGSRAGDVPATHHRDRDLVRGPRSAASSWTVPRWCPGSSTPSTCRSTGEPCPVRSRWATRRSVGVRPGAPHH